MKNHAYPATVSHFFFGHYRLAYEIWGAETGKTVLLVHGILLDSQCNHELAHQLAIRGYRVILLDLLGHGRSDKPTRAAEHRVDFYAEQVIALMDHLSLDDSIIGGVSLGAITSLTVANIAPHRVKALMLEMPVMEKAVPAAAVTFAPLMAAVHFAAPAYRLFARALRKLPDSRLAVVNSLRDGLSADPEVIRAILHGVLVGPVVPSIFRRRQIQQPTLVIGHARDALHDLADAKALKRQMPNSRFVAAKSVVELRLKPARLMPRILDFLSSVPTDKPIDQEYGQFEQQAANG